MGTPVQKLIEALQGVEGGHEGMGREAVIVDHTGREWSGVVVSFDDTRGKVVLIPCDHPE